MTESRTYLMTGRVEAREIRMSVREAILQSAEARMRVGGFHACSFREIANDVGIKSASVYYHFATKAELGAAMAPSKGGGVLPTSGAPKVGGVRAANFGGRGSIFRVGLARG